MKFVCIWFAPTYDSQVKTVDSDFLIMDPNGFNIGERLQIVALKVKEQLHFVDLIIIRVS